jgi:hypothetical protein
MLSPFGNVATASAEAALTVGALTVNDFDGPDITKIDLKFEMVPGQKTAKIKNIWYDKTSVSPGEDIELTIFLQPVGESEKRIYRTIKIPEKITGTRISIMVSGGDKITRREVRINPQKFVPQDFEHLIKLLERRRKNNILFVQVRGLDSGVLVEGREMSSLPKSVFTVMNSRHTTGRGNRLYERVILEDKIPLEYEIVGGKTGIVKLEKEHNVN